MKIPEWIEDDQRIFELMQKRMKERIEKTPATNGFYKPNEVFKNAYDKEMCDYLFEGIVPEDLK